MTGVVLFTRLVQNLEDTLFKKVIQALKSRTSPGGLCVSFKGVCVCVCDLLSSTLPWLKATCRDPHMGPASSGN